MPFRIKPIQKEFILEKSDALYGNVGGQTRVVIKQAAQRENERREGLFAKIQRRYSDKAPDEVVVEQKFSFMELYRLEAFLAIVSCNIEADSGDLLFSPEVMKDEGKFALAWGLLPPEVCDEIRECIYQTNISWAPRGELI